MRYVLGVDIGTTRTKCILFDEAGNVISSAARDYLCYRDAGHRSEQNADDWWRALVECTREALCSVGADAQVAAMSIATQGGTLVPVDAQGHPLRRAIVWNDGRGARQREQLSALCAPDDIWRKSGWTLGDNLNAIQIMWIRDNEPDVFEKTHKFLSVPDYIAYKLTGQFVIDPSNAGVNQLLNIDRCDWDEDILRAVGIRADRLPDIVQSGEIIGPLLPAAARELGLSADTLLVAGGHDQYLCALGVGAASDGDVVLASGTCWVVTAISNERPDRFLVSRTAIPGQWGALQSQETGGEALEWIRQQMLAPEQSSYSWINEEVAKVPPGAHGITFYPLLTGAYYPVVDSAIRGAFIGLSSGTTRMDMARAVMEGVCFQALWMMESFNIQNMHSIRMTGGALYSDVWVQMVADIANLPVSVPAIADAGCAGAAILAGVAVGAFSCAAEGAKALNRGGRVVNPGPNAGAYRALFARYKRNFDHLAKMYE